MMRNKQLGVCAVLVLSIAGSIISASGPALVPGPPMICQSFDIDGTKTIGDPSGKLDSIDRRTLVDETLRTLAPDVPTLIRMETLRRVTVVAADDIALAREIMLRLASRALDSEAQGKPLASAWFDAGYAAAAFTQLGIGLGFDPGREAGCNGYAWLKKAASISKRDGAIHFACALATHPAMNKGTQEVYEHHLAQAYAFVSETPHLEKNLKTHCTTWDVKISEIRNKKQAAK